MARKRKPSTYDSTPARKKSKTEKPPARHAHGDIDEGEYYLARAIVDESKDKYLIAWEDNEATGESYADTWEPKSAANKALRDEWKRSKEQKSAAARRAVQSTATLERRARPKKAVAVSRSSPALEESPEATRAEPVAQQQQQYQDEGPEIEESQPTTADAEEASGAGSPLFVPPDSPKPSEQAEPQPSVQVSDPPSTKEPHPSVQVSDPPSSYAAGAYQAFSSSQVPESAEPRRRSSSPEQEPASSVQEPVSSQVPDEAHTQLAAELASQAQSPAAPKASQWQPEEGDSSKTTENPTEVSPAPTISEPVRSVPVNFQRRTNNVVPDSQSQPGSSSFVPSGTQTQSSSAPEPRERGRPPKEVTQIILSQAPAQPPAATQSSWQGFSSQPSPTSQRQSQNKSQAEASQGSIPFESQKSVPAESQVAPATSAHSSQRPSQTFEAAQVQTQPSQSHPAVQDETREGVDQTSVQSTANSQTLSAAPAAPKSSLPIYPPATEASENSDPEPRSQPPTQSQVDLQPESDTNPPVNSFADPFYLVGGNSQTSEADVRETTERPEVKHIDLTTETQRTSGQISSIAVTPPPPRHIIAAQRAANSNVPAPSWTSPFPFQTQFSKPFSLTTSGPPQSSQGLEPPSQRLVQSQPQSAKSLGPAFEPSAASAAFSSQIHTSSPIPSGPKHSINTFNFGPAVPPRPRTPSLSPVQPLSRLASMEFSPNTPGLSAREKLKAARAQQAAKLEADKIARREARAASRRATPTPTIADTSPPKSSIPPHVTAETPAPPNPARLVSPLLMAQGGRRSPSVVPAMEAPPEITMEEMNTSERYPTLIPQASVPEGEGDKQQNGSLTGRATPVQQGPVAVESNPETTSARVVPIVLVGHQRDQYPQMVYYHQALIQRFLGTAQPDDALIDKVKTFVERMRSITLHPDLDNTETFTQYDVEPAQQATWDVSCSAKFRFLKTLLESLRNEEKHVVIALHSGRLLDIINTFLRGIDMWTDSTLHARRSSGEAHKLRVTIFTDASEEINVRPDVIIGLDNRFRHTDAAIRSLRLHQGQWTPFARLVVPGSIEHVETHLSLALSDRARLRALVSGINQLKSEAGRQEEGQLGPAESANALAAFLKGGPQGEWPLVGLSTLQDLDSQTESEIEPRESTASPVLGMKRQRAGSDGLANDDDLSKRIRGDAVDGDTNIPITVNPQDVELTHISDSVDKPTQPSDASMTDTERRLQRLLQDAQDRIEALTADLSALQYRHEDARTALITAERERDRATATATEAVLRRTDALNRESTLRNERTDLQQALDDARTRLLDHTVPERGALEALRQSLAQAAAEKATGEKRLAQARTEGDFFRDQYQTASNTAQREVAANADLRAQVADLSARASGEQVRLRGMGYDARTKQLENENRRLKAVLREQQAGLAFRDEEIARLKEAGRGRMGTRVGSPAKSRQGSPAVAEVRGKGAGAGAGGGLLHPLRNEA